MAGKRKSVHDVHFDRARREYEEFREAFGVQAQVQLLLVDAWNRERPPGSHVLVYETDDHVGRPLETVTTTGAYMHNNHTAVVRVEGKAGMVSLGCIITRR